MVKSLLLVGFGGGLGSIVRFLVSVFLKKIMTENQLQFPWATLTVNILGCFLIGLLMGNFYQENATTQSMKLLLVTGFCGGFTTFSAFGFENISFIQNQQYSLAILYTASSLLMGFLAVAFGMFLTK
ncbi:fluoride efflux transporter CrcB [Flavobacterium sp. NST-5]|uniref:Fluoride-specific ion channel FluC n=1 Tax=Flavobacterium ichthyis TaxID=2698827 RepID=A0ABW9Z9F2_9FLAO|nr:fluoride efflux transporter CrcB [Flavobacterium ichthyis]NBL65234.1 fluoride efflux transporter CrcB [Flavobacterium ichthyis]